MTNRRRETVYLRRRVRSSGNVSLFLDTCRGGKRTYEYLKLYLVPERTREDRAKNRETLKLAEAMRAKRVVELQSRDFGLDVPVHGDALFYDVMRQLIERKKGSTKAGWSNCMAHVLRYEPNERITFREITPQWVRGFRDYLDTKARLWHTDARKKVVEPRPLAQGTKVLIFQKFCAVFNAAVKEGLIARNPTVGVERFRGAESEREFLTVDEIRRLREVPAPDEEMGRAFFFACLTGLRWSDIVKLRWSEVLEWHGGRRIVFTQQKTGGREYLDLNVQAAEMLGSRGMPDELVFSKLRPLASLRVGIAAWVRSAGIEKHITFHCARHTFAVMMLDLGVDLYTLSKLLGHKSINTTQIYAKILDKNKKAAVDRIPKIF